MPLTPGTRLGTYEIVAPLGAGGMGEVFRARDTRLGREVAIKVLPAVFASDPDRLARFEREAQTLAALNHPNIAHIHGLEESGSVPALVMELVEGDDLSAVIARGALPLADALAIARQIADALEAAHEQGIIHRDLKPGNVKVRGDGTVKVLDFGLAKALDPGSLAGMDPAQSPTLTARATQLGTIIGTAAYMSPEQARGKSVDRRADIWAFGAVLYEMLTGRRAFAGDDVSTTLASVLKDEVDWSALPAPLPPSIHRLLRRCLERDPRRRLSAMGDARLELEEIAAEAPATASAPLDTRRPRIVPLAVGIAALAVLATVGVTRLLAPGAPAHGGGLARLAVTLPPGDIVTNADMMPFALSPDGTQLAYVGAHNGKELLFVRTMTEAGPVPLSGTEGARSPFFSPDGKWIGFFAAGKVKKVAVGGTELQVVCDNAWDPRGGCWGTDDLIYFAPTNIAGIWKVPAQGGTATELTRLDRAHGETSHRWPFVLPDHKTLLFTIWTGPGYNECRTVAQSLATGKRRVLMPGGNQPHYLPSGYLLYSRLDDLFAVRWRPSQEDLGGAVPIQLPEHPKMGNEGAGAYAVSETGTLVFLAGGDSRYAHQLVWVDRDGKTELVPAPERDYEAVAISPDGHQAAVQLEAGAEEIWLYDFARQTLAPLVAGNGSSQAPVWTPDGQRIVYRATRQGTRNLFWKPANGAGDEVRLTSREGVVQSPTCVSPDGRWVVYSEGGGFASNGGIWAVPLAGERTPQTLVNTPAAEQAGRVSPDGRWLAYASNASGVFEICLQPFPGPGPSQQVSNGGGLEPLWSRDGRELFYQKGDRAMAVDVSARGGVAVVGQPRVLYEGAFRRSINANTGYDVALDGRRFLRVRPTQPELPADRIDVVLGWADELKRLGAGK
jgi:Tol biopolymer transport system component